MEGSDEGRSEGSDGALGGQVITVKVITPPKPLYKNTPYVLISEPFFITHTYNTNFLPF